MAAEVERSQTIQFADPSQINEESQESLDTKPQTVNFDDNFELMEAEYVEEDDDKENNNNESKPSLQQTVSFGQNNENSDNNQIVESEEVDEEDKEAEEARIREGQNNPFSIYYKKRADAGSDNPDEQSATSETSTKKSNKRKREERDDAERNSDDETLISLKKQKISHKEEEDSEIQIEVSDDEGRKEKKKKRKHKKDKKDKKHKDKKEKKSKKSKKSRAKKQDGSDVVEETSQDPEKFLETLRQMGADSDDEDDPEFAKKLEKKLEHQRMLPMAKKVRTKKPDSALEEGDGEPVAQEDDDWFLKDEVGSTVGDLPAVPKTKASPKKKQKRQHTALGGPTRKAEFEKDSVQARMLRDADVRIEPKKAERLDVAALLKKVNQRTKQIPTFHMNQEVPEDEDMELEVEETKPRLTYDNPEELLLEDSRSSNDLAAFGAKDSSQDASSKNEVESNDEDVDAVAFVLPPEDDADTKAIHAILNRVPQATFHDPSMTQGAPTMSIMTESVAAPVDTMTAENSGTQVQQVLSEASNDSTEEQKTEEQKAMLDLLTSSNAGPALHLHYTQTQFVHASDLPADSEDSNDHPEEVISEKSNAAPVVTSTVAPVAEKPVEVAVEVATEKPAENVTETKLEENGSDEEKEFDSEVDEDDADEDDLSMVEHGEVDSGDEENALSLHQQKMREEEDAEMRYISKITSGKWREDRERNLDIMDSDEEDDDEEEEASKQSGDSKDRKRKKRSKKNKRKNPYADHALIDEKELIDDEEDEAKEEEEILKLKERVHKRNYLTVSFKSNSFLEEDKSSQGLLKMIEKSQTQTQSMSLSYSQSAEVMHDIAQDFMPSESKSVLARSKKQLNRLASSFKPQTMYSSFIFNTNSRGSGGDSNGSDENTNPNVSQSQDGTASNKTQSSGSKASRTKSVTKSKTSFFRVLEESSQQF